MLEMLQTMREMTSRIGSLESEVKILKEKLAKQEHSGVAVQQQQLQQLQQQQQQIAVPRSNPGGLHDLSQPTLNQSVAILPPQAVMSPLGGVSIPGVSGASFSPVLSNRPAAGTVVGAPMPMYGMAGAGGVAAAQQPYIIYQGGKPYMTNMPGQVLPPGVR